MRHRYNPNEHIHPYYYYPWYDIYRSYQPTTQRQNYPEVDPTQFKESAAAFQELLNDASELLGRLSESEEFAFDVMTAAQEDDLEEVKRLLESTGIHNEVEIDYNPDGITMMMQTDVEGLDCCHLEMDLRW
ncbi:hypothetical protein [Aquisalibacillus elongatus]|uniref:Uncharacterized protein n=1 Tax=Aquisalibacillus elongatus TaxID=485577 RepID=A0A3N5BTW4_9BACI|nr:hypothetical protein [Aquisalibacillus elongatus]RPF53218.1 hypothetical protein EDC24_1715 [Aquisalibacillus elongatus]